MFGAPHSGAFGDPVEMCNGSYLVTDPAQLRVPEGGGFYHSTGTRLYYRCIMGQIGFCGVAHFLWKAFLWESALPIPNILNPY